MHAQKDRERERVRERRQKESKQELCATLQTSANGASSAICVANSFKFGMSIGIGNMFLILYKNVKCF